MSIKISYIDVVSCDAPELNVECNNGKIWRVSIGSLGWIPVIIVDNAFMRPSYDYMGLPEVLNDLLHSEDIELVPLFKENRGDE